MAEVNSIAESGPGASGQTGASGETLANEAYRVIKADILRCERAPGERLRIDRLRGIYGIGPSPIREALQRLSADRLVVAEGNRGFVVAPLDPEEFADLNTARIAVEKEALRMSVATGGLEWEGRVVAASYVMHKEDAALMESDSGVPDSWEKANSEFHSAIVSACGSRWLLWTRSHLHELCERYRRASVSLEAGSRGLGAEHRAIADAAIERDAERVCQLTERHFERTALMFKAGDKA